MLRDLGGLQAPAAATDVSSLVFHMIDRDGDGVISKPEWDDAMSQAPCWRVGASAGCAAIVRRRRLRYMHPSLVALQPG